MIAQISADKVSFQYKSSEEFALNNLNFSISKGTFVLLCGATGSGKTTLIRSLNGLIPHFYHGKFYGYLRINDVDTCEIEKIAALSERIGTVFQIPENQLFAMDVERELAFGLENLGFPREEIRKRIENAIQTLDIEHLRHRPPYKLSGGEQQKVAIASILTLNPDILILDEPLSNLDPQSAVNMVSLLKSLQTDLQKTIIISEHRLEYVLAAADEIVVMNNGKIILHDKTDIVVNADQIYRLGLDVPPILRWFWELKQQEIFKGPIPLSFEEQQRVISSVIGQLNVKLEKMATHSGNPTQSNNIHSLVSISSSKIPSVILDNVSFSFISGELTTPVLKNLSLVINSGEILGIMGANGAGKSTLIRSIMGLVKPAEGDVWIKGVNVTSLPIYEIAKTVGLMFQNPDHQLFGNTVLEELHFSLKNLHLPKKEVQARIDEILKELDLESLAEISPFNISGGQKKKVSLAAILCRQPEILIFDEPTIGQDAEQKARLRALIRKFHQKGCTIIIVSHDMGFLADLTTRTVVIDDGKILADGSSIEIFRDSYILEQASLHPSDIDQLFMPLREKYPMIPPHIFSYNPLQEMLPNNSTHVVPEDT